MKRQKETRPARLKASIGLVALALLAIGFLQFDWFSRSAAGEIEAAYRSVAATVSQAASREYQRYAPLLGELRSLRAKAPLSRKALEEALERAFAAYGPSGVTPRLLLSVRIIEAASGLGGLAEREAEALAHGELGLASGQGGSRSIVAMPDPASSLLLELELDSAGFFESYVEPAIAAVLPDAELDWYSGAPLDFGSPPPIGGEPPGGEPRRGVGYSDRRFNPIRALLGGGAAAAFEIPVSESFGPRFSPGKGPPAKPDEAFRLMPLGIEGRPWAESRRLLRVTPSRSSSMGSVERRLALNWLSGTLLLVGVGLAFAQALLQRRRLGLLRQREREFVASVTHELRTPLTVIGSAADNLRRGLVTGERLAEYGELIAGQSARLGAMIEEVLLYSEVEGRAPRQPTLSKTGPERLEAELRGPLEELLRGAGSSLDWDLGGLPPAFLGDQAGIALVLSNLVANAAFHAYEKGSGGHVRVWGGRSGPTRLFFKVEDEGRGIPRAEASLVFEPFYQAEEARSLREKGTGLGLFLARRKARAMGGELRLESPYRRADGSRRRGCRFILELPLAEAGDAD